MEIISIFQDLKLIISVLKQNLLVNTSQRMQQRSGKCCKQPVNNCVTQKQHFNYLRNNSCGMYGILEWGNNDAKIQDQTINLKDHYQKTYRGQNEYANNDDTRKQQEKKGNRRVSFDDTNVNVNRNQGDANINVTNTSKNKNQGKKTKNQRPSSSFQRKSKLQKDQQGEKRKNEQNKQKVMEYIQSIRPYTRGLSNTKFQDYFGKAAPQCYGRANTNQPIGGIIYGNHLKTFNVNPHVFTNNPEYYQTHTTAINYGKRAKVCEDAKWKKLQKQLSKKLGLKQKNQAIKQGKQVVYVDVDDNNKYQVLRQNHQFQKANKQQIHQRQLQYKKDKHQQYLDDIQQYYAKKQQNIANNLSTMQSVNGDGSNLSPQQFESKLNQQVVYRYHDKNGNVRLAADRHGMTCFVDMNFPENQAAYVEQLKNRMPIFPKRVQGEDKNLDAIRKQNCKKGHEQIYPSHYLLRNCEQPQVLKMLSNKTGVKLSGRDNKGSNANARSPNGRKVGVNSPTNVNINKSFVSTANTQGQRNAKGDNQYQDSFYNSKARDNGQYNNRQYMKANKSQILDRAWGNRQIAGQINCNLSKTCCANQHLPHNQMNPQCYKSSGVSVGRIPYAG